MTVYVGTNWLDNLSFVYIGSTSLSEEEKRCRCDCVLCPWLEGRFYCRVRIDRLRNGTFFFLSVPGGIASTYFCVLFHSVATSS